MLEELDMSKLSKDFPKRLKAARQWLEDYKKLLLLSKEDYEYMNDIFTSLEEKVKEGEKDEQ